MRKNFFCRNSKFAKISKLIKNFVIFSKPTLQSEDYATYFKQNCLLLLKWPIIVASVYGEM